MKYIYQGILFSVAVMGMNFEANARNECHELQRCAINEYKHAIHQEAGKTLGALNEKWTPILNCCKKHNNSWEQCAQSGFKVPEACAAAGREE